jgi:hypothetical protein
MVVKSYQEVMKRVGNDEMVLYVEPAIARKFFVDRYNSRTKEKIGESLFNECLLVKTCWVLEYIFMLACLMITPFVFQWYSIIVLPLMLVGFTVGNGEVSMGKQRLADAFTFTIICFLLAFYFRDREMLVTVWLILLPLPYLCARLTYKLATQFHSSLSKRNDKAFTLLYGNRIVFKEECTNAADYRTEYTTEGIPDEKF